MTAGMGIYDAMQVAFVPYTELTPHPGCACNQVVTEGDSLRSWLQLCRADVQTYCFGLAASMGAFLLGAGAKGKRYSMPNARIMIHQPLGGASGQAVDIEIQAKEIMYHKGNLNRIMSECTGQPIEKVLRVWPLCEGRQFLPIVGEIHLLVIVFVLPLLICGRHGGLCPLSPLMSMFRYAELFLSHVLTCERRSGHRKSHGQEPVCWPNLFAAI